MASGTIYVPVAGDGAAPQRYTVPGVAILDLEAVRADFDGSGAASAWVPAVQILDSSGHVMAQSVGETVAAGGSASVTFAPFLRSGGGGGASSAVVAWGVLAGASNPQNVPAYPTGGYNTPLDLSGGSFAEDGSGVFAFDPLFPTNIICTAVPATGWFVMQVQYSVDTFSNPIDVTAVFANPYIEDPPGFGPSGTESAATRGYVSPRVDTVVGASTWTAIAIEPNEGFSSPLGFGLEALNYDATAATLVVIDPKIVVTLIGG